MAHPLRSRPLLALLAAGVLHVSVQAQLVERAPRLLLDALELESATVQELVLPFGEWRPFETRVVLEGTPFTLHLEPHDLRAADFELVSMGPKGLRSLEAPAPTTYRGTVEGLPGSVVAASLYFGQFSGIVLHGEDLWGIQPASEGLAWLPWRAHVVYHRREVGESGFACGVEATSHGSEANGPGFPDAASIAEVALELEPRFRQTWGGLTPAVHQAISIMNGVDAIYQANTSVAYQLTRLVTREAGYRGNSTTILNQMTNTWNTRGWEIRRDLAHCFVGPASSNVIGVAWLSSVCGSQQYSVSWHTSSLVTRIAVTAHEFGHSWSAGHCNGANPCNIMCSSINGCSSNITQFAPVSVNAIDNFAATRTCLN